MSGPVTPEPLPGPAGGPPRIAPKAGGRPLLQVEDISLSFGGLKALDRVSLEIREGEILAIIGPNGAGKTSLLNVINGVYHPQQGRVLFEGQDRTRFRPHAVANQGVARTFQNLGLFRAMTVLENLMTGRKKFIHTNFFLQAMFWGPAQKAEIEQRERVEQIIDFLGIEHIRKVPVGTLPYGMQKRVELGRALAAEPKLLLLDEPMAGMNLEEKEDISRFILDANEELGITIALIEHDMGVVMDICDRIVVLDYGSKIADGPPAEIRNHPDVIRAYLGTTDD
ncbi:MAG: ABC transporter ATP-binding protein [SAR324 cluster bacterium]|nr:ABC transporter ATP-binding protein [SAR324 cluster bacterium]